MEFGNRLVTVVLTVAVAAAFLGSVFRSPRRRDLMWLSGGLVAGVLAQAVLGGIVVYTKLNPYLVMVHFFATMLLLVDAVVLVHRSTRDYTPGSGHLLVPRPLIRLFYGALALLAARDRRRHRHHRRRSARRRRIGPAGGEADPHRPARHGRAALEPGPAPDRRHHRPGGGLHMGDVPERVRRAARILLVVMVAQAGVGYTQYFTHLPALLVEVHILGVTALVIGAVQTFLACTYHAPEVLPAPVVLDRAEPSVPIGAH